MPDVSDEMWEFVRDNANDWHGSRELITQMIEEVRQAQADTVRLQQEQYNCLLRKFNEVNTNFRVFQARLIAIATGAGAGAYVVLEGIKYLRG